MEQSSGRTLNAVKNLSSGIGNKVISLLFVFVSRRIFVQYIGIAYLGISSLFSNILSILSLADLGFGVAMSYSFYKPLAERNEYRIAALIHFYKRIYNLIAIAILSLGLLLLPFIDKIVQLESEIPHLKLYYLLYLLQTVCSYLFVYKTNIITADQKNYILNNMALVINFIRTILQLAVIILTKSFFLYTVIQLLSVVVHNGILSYITDKKYSYIKRKCELRTEERKEIFLNLRSIFIYKISGTFMNSIDSIVISLIGGTVILGLYSNYLIISSNVSIIISIIFGSFTAGIGNLIVSENRERRFNIFQTLQMISNWLSAVILLCFIFLAQDFIGLWLGKAYCLDSFTVLIIGFDLYLGTSFQPLWSYREATGLYMKTKYIMLCAALMNLVLSIILGIYIGVAGVILASILCRILTYFWYEPITLFHIYFDKKANVYFLSYFKNIFAVFILFFEMNFMIGFFPTGKWGIWILKGSSIFLIVTIQYYIIYRNKKDFLFVKEKVRLFLNGQNK